MQHLFQSFIQQQKLCGKADKILLSVSGGLDSMVMAHLFLSLNNRVAVAHCNFQLRGTESDEDEKFVMEFAKKYKLPYYVKSFDTQKFAAEQKISIQMAARKLRVAWFESLIVEHNYTVYATAHHLDDQIETFFNNLIRGTGIAGLRGMLPKNGKLIHPMLFCFRSDIKQFAENNNIAFREDSSNNQTKYQRNKIRHEIIPKLEEIKPDFRSVMTRNIENLEMASEVYESHINQLIDRYVIELNGDICIDKIEICKLRGPESILFELVKPYNFNVTQVGNIVKNTNQTSGKVFYSDTHRLVIDRKHYIISRHINSKNRTYQINRTDKEILQPVKLVLTWHRIIDEITINTDPNFAMLDARKLSFPLILRKWEKGDYFFPLGMSNKKLISDFFIDNKFSIPQKENTWLMESNGQIAWIVGYRIDDRFKISTSTNSVFQLQLKGFSPE